MAILEPTVLIVADAFDAHADVVESSLIELGCRAFRLNLDVDSLKRTRLTLCGLVARIETPLGSLVTDRADAVWARRAFLELNLEEREAETVSDRIWRNEWNRALLGLYNVLGRHPWLSPLPLALRAENKYLQWSVAQEIGFRVPHTLTSNDKETLLTFCQQHGGSLAFKAMHQDIYRVGDQVVGLFTNLISREHLDGFQDEAENPITVQEYVSKDYEVRYTVVGSEHFCCKIESQAAESTKIDWRRYDIPRTPHYAIVPPSDVQVRVNRFMETLGLGYGALDFIVTPEGEWVLLEVNPMGQWLWIEDLTGLPISASIVKKLIDLARKQHATEGTIG